MSGVILNRETYSFKAIKDHSYCLTAQKCKNHDDHSYSLTAKIFFSNDDQSNKLAPTIVNNDNSDSRQSTKINIDSDHSYHMKSDNGKRNVTFTLLSHQKQKANSTVKEKPSKKKKYFELEQYKGPSSIVQIGNLAKKSLHVPGDGNCFFHTLSLLKHGDFSMSQYYRTSICSYILNNWHEWEASVTLCHESVCTKNQYYRHMLCSNGWATAVEIQAACKVLHLNISVWLRGILFSTNERRFLQQYTNQIYETENAETTLELLLSNSHFTVLTNISHQITGQDENEKVQNRKCSYEQNTTQPKAATATSNNEEAYVKVKNISANRSTPSESACHQNDKKKTNYPYINTHGTDKNCTLPISDSDIYQKCRKLGIPFPISQNKDTTKQFSATFKAAQRQIRSVEKKLNVNVDTLPSPPPLVTDNPQFNKAMDCIRAFELQQMSYTFKHCLVCHERKLEMKMANETTCSRCNSDKNNIKMFSEENKMNPMSLPNELKDLTLVEQQLISRIAPAINIHLLKHGGIAANGHCVTFPQNVNEPAQILPKLPDEIQIIRVRRQGSNDTSKEFNVCRSKVENALKWLKSNNPAYADITISKTRLELLPENANLDINTVETSTKQTVESDEGPAPEQVDPGEIDGESYSCVSLPEQAIKIRDQVEQVVKEVVGPNHGKVTEGKKYVCIPWPSKGDSPVSEFTTRNFFTFAFPALFPYGLGDFHMNRPRTCNAMSQWAEHLMWFEDGRFAQHAYFKFIVHNIIMRKRTLEQSSYIVKQQLGDEPPSLSDLKQMLNQGDVSIAQKVLYFGACLRGTSQYWAQRNKELQSLIQYKISEGKGLPSFFTTGSCAEYHFKPLRNILHQYIFQTTGVDLDLSNRSTLFNVLQKNTHIVSQYFDLRTVSYFQNVMCNAFAVDTFWYRQEFAKSRGMVHWHGLCWRSDREPHNLINEAIQRGLSEEQYTHELSEWAKEQFSLAALHPGGKDSMGNPRKDLWPPPEGTAEAPPEGKNPLEKLLMDVSDSQETLLEDYLLLCNRINIHRCSSYCLQLKKGEKVCRMEFGPEKNPGKLVRSAPAIVNDKNGSMRLELERDHPMLVQHSRFHTQGWRANGDISLILSKSPPDNPSIDEIIGCEKYITGYACKGNDSTGALSDLFHDIAHVADENTGASVKSVCTKLLMNTVKRDISSMEASYELLSLPLYRCSHEFQSISFTGSRVLERKGHTLTKATPLDKYLSRPEDQLCSWYQFVCDQGKVPVVSGTSMRATWPLNDDYCRSMLLLHWPSWRSLNDIKTADSTWTDTFINFLQTDQCPNFVKAAVERAKRHCQKTSEDNEDSESENEYGTPPEWMEVLQPNPNFSDQEDNHTFDDGGPHHDWSQYSRQYPQDFGLKWLDTFDKDISQVLTDISLQTIVQLNEEQVFAFNLVLSTLLQYKNDPSSVEQLRLIVSGTAGSGKSFLIKCLVHSIRTLFNNDRSVQVVCPTGNSSNLISGRTIHDFLKIPTTGKLLKEMKSPAGSVADILQQNFANLKALIVDERSLVGSTTLGWMEFHCRFALNTQDKPWGGLPVVIFLGDDVQLPPVCDSPVYMAKTSTPACMHGSLVWKYFNCVVELKTVVRQNTDQIQLKTVLGALRQYNCTSQHAAWLQQYQWDSLRTKHGEQLLTDMTENGLFVFPTHDQEIAHNTVQLVKANAKEPVAMLSALNTGCHAKSSPSDKAGGLQNTLHICVGAKVMLTSNLLVPYGLFNGSVGIVRDIIFLDGRTPKDSLPDVVMVSFSKYSGPPFVLDEPNIVPIVPVERRIDCSCRGCKRKQVPLRLGWGTTIHRCQGMTIGEGEPNRYIVIHPGSKSFESRNPGALFVALSRAKTAGSEQEYPDFAFHQSIFLNEDRICHKVNTPTTRARNQEVQRLHKLDVQTKQKFTDKNSRFLFNKILGEIFQENNIEE